MKLDIILAFITTSFLKMERGSPDFQSLEPIAPVSMATWTTPQTPTDGQPVPWRTLQPTTTNVYTITRNSALRNVRNAHDNIPGQMVTKHECNKIHFQNFRDCKEV